MSYRNPVYPYSLPDPFVLKFRGEYWGYGSGFTDDGHCIPIVQSPDLVHWRQSGAAMDPLPGNFPEYWAPEVAYLDGRFYLYYSVGNETLMEIRVAVSDHPGGPFVDAGRRLTNEDFAIDAHMFEDEDGERYLFYATDFLDYHHIGTGTVCDRMLDPLTLAGHPFPVTRARFDWQVYDPHRLEKGGVRWHTVEGPFVLKRKGLYYEMFSGGNWQNISYGVSYAVSDRIEAPEEWRQVADGEEVLPVLRTIPGKVIGPGHNSVVRGPDNRQLYCIYHEWVEGERVMAIDRLDWASERLIVLGPTTESQPAPIPPTMAGFAEGEDSQGVAAHWKPDSGSWRVQDSVLVQDGRHDEAEIRCDIGQPHFVAEVSVHAVRATGDEGWAGVGLLTAEGATWRCLLSTAHDAVRVVQEAKEGRKEELIPLAAEFEPPAYHLFRFEVDGRRLHCSLDALTLWRGEIASIPISIGLRCEQAIAAFAGFELTIGWEDLFTEDVPIETLGWQLLESDEPWTVRDCLLYSPSDGNRTSKIWKGPLLPSYEAVVNIRLDSTQDGGGYGFNPAALAGQGRSLLLLARWDGAWVLQRTDSADAEAFELPAGFDPAQMQQFRFRKQDGRLRIQWENTVLGEIDVPAEPTALVLLSDHAKVAVDMVRLTSLP